MDQGHLLVTVHEIVDNILSNLPLPELINNRCVCKFWRDCIDRILRCRPKEITVSSNFFKGRHDAYVVGTVNAMDVTDNGEHQLHQISTRRRIKRSRIAQSRNSCHLLQSFLDWRHTWTSIPQFIIMIHKLNVNWVDEDVERHYKDFHEALLKHIPPTTELIVVRSSTDEEFDFADLTVENEAVCFSSVPMTKIHCFSSLPLERKKLGQGTLEHLKTFFQDTADIKYFLFFYKKNQKIQKWVTEKLCPMLVSFTSNHSKMVVAGCALPDAVIHTKISELKSKTSGDPVFFDEHGAFFSICFAVETHRI